MNIIDLFRKKEEKEPEFLDTLEEGLIQISGDVLDTTSKENIAKLKHNLEYLIKEAKEKGQIDRFMLIREDDYFPISWQWQVLSKDTNLESVNTKLSYELRIKYALEQNNIKSTIDGLDIPVSHSDIMKSLEKVPKNLGNVYLPPRFRSTKHFTINTPLGYTGNYNNVTTERNFIVLDDIDNFLNSGYAYSVSYHDAYLDVSHEALRISNKGIVLINKEKYESIKNNAQIMEELNKHKYIIFEGDENLAILMVLSELGVLPSQVPYNYAEYDNELQNILDKSIMSLAASYGLYYDKSHFNTTKMGHFTSYYDDQNTEYNEYLQKFIDFLKKKYPECKEFDLIKRAGSNISDMINTIGTKELLGAIEEFNKEAYKEYTERYVEYQKDRKKITPEIHNIFTTIVGLVNDYYKSEINYENVEEKNEVERLIKDFFQSNTVSKQLESGKSLLEYFKIREKQEENEVLKY